jgi:hypothetical protein
MDVFASLEVLIHGLAPSPSRGKLSPCDCLACGDAQGLHGVYDALVGFLLLPMPVLVMACS